jgi:ATP-binding protein involved in chromosome partitioning
MRVRRAAAFARRSSIRIPAVRDVMEETVPTAEQVTDALRQVEDPTLDKRITELDMVADVTIDGVVARIEVLEPVPGAASQELGEAVRDAVRTVPGIEAAEIKIRPMPDEQRTALAQRLRGDRPAAAGGQPVIPFAQMDSNTKVLAIASGKGGVGKSSITTNLAVALAKEGHKVGVLDADVWGYSIPRMLGVSGSPVPFGNMVVPLRAHGCKVISIGFFIDAERPVVWRGPMLHRALQQFLADVYWGDLDFLLCDLPPGTGDVAISLAQMLPNADMLVVTTPQPAAQRVALRAGQVTAQTGMRVAGVIENMASFIAPDTGTEYRIFGEGGGELLAEELDTQLLGSIPIDVRLREGADEGVPLTAGDPDAPASRVLYDIARKLTKRKTSMVGRSLPLMG